MLLVKFLDHLGGPRSLFGAITPIVHEVLNAPPTPAGSDYMPDSECSIDKARQTSWGQEPLVNWLHLGDVEGGACSHGPLEPRAYSCQANDPLDDEGPTNLMVLAFWTLSVEASPE